MQNGFIGLPGALVLASTMAIVGCSEPASSGGVAGGGASSGGVAGGGASSGGVAGGGASSGGAAGASSGGVAGGGASSGGAGGASSGGAGGASSCTMDQGGSDVTSISGNCPLNSLSAAQATQLCTDTSAYVAGALSKANACKYAALVAAASSSAPTDEELQAACTSSESACNGDPSSMGPGVLCTEIPATCTATVAQYSTCIMDETMAFDQGVIALDSCSTLTFDGITAIYEVPDNAGQVASCTALTTMCPGFYPPYIN